MARARNIKPGLFKNEDLAECSVWARLIFPGLWMLADREGRLEDRPKRIKGELLPYDSIEVEPLLAELAEHGFIRRYEVCGERFIFIVKFLDHQTPHGTEKDGHCPDENGFLTIHERGKNGYITGNRRLEPYRLTVKEQKKPDEPPLRQTSNGDLTVKDGGQDGGQNTLIPDSLIPDSLIPDSLIPDTLGEHLSGKPDDEPEKILAYLNVAANRGYRPVPSNIKLIRARLKEGATPAEMRAVIDLKVKQWAKDPKRAQYLRPETLFNATKFAQYVGQLGAGVPVDDRSVEGFLATFDGPPDDGMTIDMERDHA